MDSKDSLSDSGDRRRRPRPASRSAMEGEGDLDSSENFASMVKKTPPRRTLSGELEGSLVMHDPGWKSQDTVHQNKFAAFDDSESMMEDSFAGSSFASTQDSFCCDDDAAVSQFTKLEEEPASKPPGSISVGTAPRRNTPRRSFSKHKKQMPKKSAPMSAISEADDGASVESES